MAAILSRPQCVNALWYILKKTSVVPILTLFLLEILGVQCQLTHWGRVTHICVSNLTIIGSDNGLSHWRRQAIIWTNAGIFVIRPLGTNFSEILIGNQTFSFMKMHLKMSVKWRPFCLGLNVLMCYLCMSSASCSVWGRGWSPVSGNVSNSIAATRQLIPSVNGTTVGFSRDCN